MVLTNHPSSEFPTYLRMFGVESWWLVSLLNKGDFKVAGKSVLYSVFILVDDFMKRLTVARQRLALHDPKQLFIKILLFIKNYHSSSRMINHK